MTRARHARGEEGEGVVKTVMTKMSLAMLAVAAVLASAQTASAGDTIKAKIPFAFVVNGVELPPGDYVVTRDESHPDLIEISTASGERRALTLTHPAGTSDETSAQPKLEFERVGDQVFLSGVTMGQGVDREIVTPAAADEPRPKQ